MSHLIDDAVVENGAVSSGNDAEMSVSMASSSSPTCFTPLQTISPLQPINITLELPVTRLTVSTVETVPTQTISISYCRKSKRLKNRKQVFYKMGLKSHWIDDKKLLTAVQNSELSKVSELLEQGVNPNVCDQKKRTPLHIAASQGQDYIVGLLLSKRADPNRQDILGNSPLHLAVCRGDLATVKLLIENGSNIFISDNAGRTPLSLVRNRLGGLRRNKTSSTDAFKTEFILMSELLCSPATRRHDPDPFVTSIDDLCNQMQLVSTREGADEIADAAIQRMSSTVSALSLSNIPLL